METAALVPEGRIKREREEWLGGGEGGRDLAGETEGSLERRVGVGGGVVLPLRWRKARNDL